MRQALFVNRPNIVDAARCPFCWRALKESRSQVGVGGLPYALLECYCGTYPLVGGIPILQKQPQNVLSRIVSFVETGELNKALALAISPLAIAPPQSPGLAPAWAKGLPTIKGFNRVKHLLHLQGLRKWESQSADLLMRNGHSTVLNLNAFFFQDRQEAFNYFAYRFGQPRHLVALSFATIIKEPQKPI